MADCKKIAILSGKGGTGKTMLAVNLSASMPNSCYIDCDAEEPNGHLFFRPANTSIKDVFVDTPKVDKDKCIACKKCVEFCKFGALAFVNHVMLFDEICHSCGGCGLVCPSGAISYQKKQIGYIATGVSDSVKIISGNMNTGEVSAVPIISKMLEMLDNDKSSMAFIDCPPGSSCAVMDSIKDADFCILVAEPTIFGCHNLQMVYELTTMFNKPIGVVLNKCESGYNPSEQFCLDNNIQVLAKIPYDNILAKINSNADIAVRSNYSKKDIFHTLLHTIRGIICDNY